MSTHASNLRNVGRAAEGRLRSLILTGAIAAIAAHGLGGVAHAGDPQIPRTPAVEGARVYIISPVEGATVTSPVTVQFGLSGMGVAPAGVDKVGTGHHHLIIDAPLPPAGLPVPADANHRHFGGGQTEVSIDLSPGTHTLQLLVADHQHVPHDPPLASEIVTITVTD